MIRSQNFIVTVNDQSVHHQLQENKKFELMLTGRVKAYSNHPSQY